MLGTISSERQVVASVLWRCHDGRGTWMGAVHRMRMGATEARGCPLAERQRAQKSDAILIDVRPPVSCATSSTVLCVRRGYRTATGEPVPVAKRKAPMRDPETVLGCDSRVPSARPPPTSRCTAEFQTCTYLSY